MDFLVQAKLIQTKLLTIRLPFESAEVLKKIEFNT